MLIVVEDRNIELILQRLLDEETFRRLDVFQIDAAERGRDGPDDFDDDMRIVRVHFDVEHVHVGEALEQHAFAFHHGLRRQRAAIAKAENRRAVGDDGDEIRFGGVLIR